LRELTTEQVENIQIDYGLVYINFGEVGERKLGPSKGGATFNATKTLRDIEFDGRKGKSKSLQHVDEINAMLSVSILDTSMDNLALAMPYANYAADVLTCKSSNIGIVPDGAYLTNVVMFAKLISGGYKKITIFNAMTENDFSLSAVAKGEGLIALEIHAHWDVTDDDVDLYKIEDVLTLGSDTTKPTVVSVPADAATDIVVGANLTATFSEEIKQSDISTSNFILIKVSDGAIMAGTISYNSATKVATFDPTDDLAAATAYIWMIARVRDTAGNIMDPVTVNFTTAA